MDQNITAVSPLTMPVSINSQESVQSRFEQGRIPRYGPFLMIVGSIPDFVQGFIKLFWMLSGKTRQP